jgi:hypothetical protein
MSFFFAILKKLLTPPRSRQRPSITAYRLDNVSYAQPGIASIMATFLIGASPQAISSHQDSVERFLYLNS